MTKKQITLIIHPEIKETLKKETAEKWLTREIPKYQPKLKTPPIPYQKKITYKPNITLKTLDQLQKIPGDTYTTKITNLYYNTKTRQQKTKQRKEMLKKLFPNNTYN